MKIERWGNNIVIPVSQQELMERGLSVGDEVDLRAADAVAPSHQAQSAKEAMFEHMRKHARPLPPGYKFNRAEANGFDEE